MEDFEAEDPLVPLVDPIDISALKVTNDRSGVASRGVEFETSVDFNEPEEKDIKFKAEDIYNNRFLPDDDDDSDADEDDETSPFEKMIKKMEDISPNGDGMVYKKLLTQGSGNVVPEGAIVRIHYNGYLEYGDEPFDSTRLRNRPYKVKLETGGLIVGLDLAVGSMRVGELARIIIRPQYAFGEMGTPPRIPKDATVMYEVELMSFVEHGGVDEIELLSEEERQQISFDDILNACTAYRQEAKQQYDISSYKRASVLYRKAVMLLEKAHLKNQEEDDLQQTQLLKMYINLACCCTKIRDSRHGINWCKRALDICTKDKENTDPFKESKIKALYHFGKALHHQGHFQEARTKLMAALKLSGLRNKKVSEALADLNSSMEKEYKLEKELNQRMFSRPKGISNDEKEKENKKHQDMEENCTKVSEKYRELVIEHLTQFKNDKKQTEIPFTSHSLTFGEIHCILEEADNLDLKAVEVGSGQNSRIKIVRRSDHNTAC